MIQDRKAFDAGPVLVKLRERQPEQHGAEYDFASALADKLPKGTMLFSAFVLQAKLLLHDMAIDAPILPPRPLGFPVPVLAVLDMGLRDLARRVLPGEEAAAAVEMLDLVEGRRHDPQCREPAQLVHHDD